MLDLLRESIHLQKTEGLTVSGITEIKERYKKLMQEDISALRHEFREFQKGLSAYSEHLFLFFWKIKMFLRIITPANDRFVP